jgi:hypothetical protein
VAAQALLREQREAVIERQRALAAQALRQDEAALAVGFAEEAVDAGRGLWRSPSAAAERGAVGRFAVGCIRGHERSPRCGKRRTSSFGQRPGVASSETRRCGAGAQK